MVKENSDVHADSVMCIKLINKSHLSQILVLTKGCFNKTRLSTKNTDLLRVLGFAVGGILILVSNGHWGPSHNNEHALKLKAKHKAACWIQKKKRML